jgi:hypothetical protein
MNSVSGPGQPVQPPPGGKRAMSTSVVILLITVGAVLRLAVSARSVLGLNVHVVGIILVLAGVLGLLMPRLAHAPLSPDRLRRWVRPNQPEAYDEAPTGVDPGVYDDRPALVQDHGVPDDRGPLVEDLVGYENHQLP